MFGNTVQWGGGEQLSMTQSGPERGAADGIADAVSTVSRRLCW